MAAQARLRRIAEKETAVFEFEFDAPRLAYSGPVITTFLSITDEHKEALTKAGLVVPAEVPCRFLIDTGAYGSLVRHEFAERAGLKLISENVPIHGVGVDTTGRTYVGRIVFRKPSRRVAGLLTVTVDTQIMSGTLPISGIDGLIGRDVLQHFEVIYNGATGRVSMKYLKPHGHA